MLRAMGKLAERYGDASRSGLYRVRDAAIPRTAAAEAGALLLEVTAARIAQDWAGVREALAAERTRACVILVTGAATLADPRHRTLLEDLASAAQARREAGPALFAVMVDPEGRLGLQPLYHERGAGQPS